jgi:hypothetical protein
MLAVLDREIFLDLWIPLIQQIMDNHVLEYNNFRMRKQRNTGLPSGRSPNYCYDSPATLGGVQNLLPIPTEVIDRMITEQYPDIETLFETQYPGIHNRIRILLREVFPAPITLANVWVAFREVYKKLTVHTE